MQLQSTLLAISALTTAVSAFTDSAVWDDQLKVWNIGAVASLQSKRAHYREGAPVAGSCAAANLREGDYACGSLEERGVDAMRAIYRCTDGWLEIAETCHGNDRCVKNERRKRKKFYPFVDGNKVVCQKKSKVEKA